MKYRIREVRSENGIRYYPEAKSLVAKDFSGYVEENNNTLNDGYLFYTSLDAAKDFIQNQRADENMKTIYHEID